MTLVEVMVAMSIGVAVFSMAVGLLFQGTKASYQAAANVENSMQQWGLAAKLQIDGKVADGITIFRSADTATWVAGLPVEVPVDNGNAADGLERGKILVLTKCERDASGLETQIITDMIFYLYTGGGGTSAAATGTLKRYPKKAPETFPVTPAMAKDSSNNPKTVAQLVSENFLTFTGGAELVQDNLVSVATDGPFAHFGNGKNASIALVREETALGKVKNSNLTEVSFNLR